MSGQKCDTNNSCPQRQQHRTAPAPDRRRDRRLGLCLPGSLVERTTRCGSARCRCHTDPTYLHGPYPSWIRKAGTRTITRTLSPAQLERYRPCSTTPSACAS